MFLISAIQQLSDFPEPFQKISVPFAPISKVPEFSAEWKAP
jgi:hypothetical protein